MDNDRTINKSSDDVVAVILMRCNFVANYIVNIIKVCSLCFSLLCISSTASANLLDGIGCDHLTKNKVVEIIKQRNPLYIQNPFDYFSCVPISFRSDDKSIMTFADMANSKALLSKYQDFLKSNETMITRISLSGHQVVKFFKITEETKEHRRFLKNVGKTSILKTHHQTWSFFHELMHLSARTEEENLRLVKIEATADIGSVLMVSLVEKLPAESTLLLMREIIDIRKKDFKKGGVHHYNRISFKNAFSNLPLINQLPMYRELQRERNFCKVLIKTELLAFDAQNLSLEKFKLKYLGIYEVVK